MYIYRDYNKNCNITAHTLRGIKGRIETEEIKNVKLKGINKPIDVYNVVRYKD